MTTKTITVFVDHPSHRQTSGTATPVGNFTEGASLLISYSMSTLIDKETALRVTNTTESPYSIKKNTETDDFAVVTPEQSNLIKPVDAAIFGTILEGVWYDYLPKRITQNKQTRATE